MTQEQQKFLDELVGKLSSLDNRATQFPLFVVQVDKKAYGDSSWCNEAERKEESDGEMCKSCKEKEENNEEVPDYCDDCDSDCFVWFNWEEEFDLQAGVFLTDDACNQHIKTNSYHYTNPRSYAISAWRNWEMQGLFKLLFELAGKEIPSHYR